jgi:predicted transcriptional regulator
VPRFGDLEAAIMEQVWSAGEPITVRQILTRLDRDPTPAYNTVLTVTEILFRKGWLTREKHGKAHRYMAAVGREDYTAHLVDEALQTAPDRTAALLRFVERMEPAEVAELRSALAAAKAGRDRGNGVRKVEHR